MRILLILVCACGDRALVSPDASLDPSPDAAVQAGFPDPSGFANTAGPARSGPFFASLGTNGRSCATCHDVASGWTITPRLLADRTPDDPIFRSNDGAVSPTADPSDPQTWSMLLRRGTIRVGLPIPANAEFTLTAVDDPYGFASAQELSLFRRPLPATDLSFESTLMWDGREPSLAQQAIDATVGHAQGATPSAADVDAIVAFESSLTSAQIIDTAAGPLDDGADGGLAALAAQPVVSGSTHPFALFSAWLTSDNARRASIARGENIFETRPIDIVGVGGLSDRTGTCATCHDRPGAGDHATPLLVNIGQADARLRTPDLPLYTLTRTSDGATVQTTDPGAALVTGKWDDIGRFKVPTLRGLAARAPYFHAGFARTLDDVVGFYDRRFRLGLTPPEHADLVAFLASL